MRQLREYDTHEWVEDFIDLIDGTAITLCKIVGAMIGFSITIYIMC